MFTFVSLFTVLIFLSSKISGLDYAKCNETDECVGETISIRGIIQCYGYGACVDSNLYGSYAVQCFGFGACASATINSCPLSCDGAYSCQYATMNSIYLNYCGTRACNYVTVSGAGNGGFNCQGPYSCQYSDITRSGQVTCSGKYACANSNVSITTTYGSNAGFDLYCDGAYGCQYSALEVASNDVFCSAYYGCQYADVTADRLFCSGQSSCNAIGDLDVGDFYCVGNGACTTNYNTYDVSGTISSTGSTAISGMYIYMAGTTLSVTGYQGFYYSNLYYDDSISDDLAVTVYGAYGLKGSKIYSGTSNTITLNIYGYQAAYYFYFYCQSGSTCQINCYGYACSSSVTYISCTSDNCDISCDDDDYCPSSTAATEEEIALTKTTQQKKEFDNIEDLLEQFQHEEEELMKDEQYKKHMEFNLDNGKHIETEILNTMENEKKHQMKQKNENIHLTPNVEFLPKSQKIFKNIGKQNNNNKHNMNIIWIVVATMALLVITFGIVVYVTRVTKKQIRVSGNTVYQSI